MNVVCSICLGCGFGTAAASEWRHGQLELILESGIEELDLQCKSCRFLRSMICSFLPTAEFQRQTTRLRFVLGEPLKLTVDFFNNLGRLYASDYTLKLPLVLHVEQPCESIPQLPCLPAYCKRSDEPACFDFLRKSLHDCYTNHEHGLCGPRIASPLPTRVLRLSESDPYCVRLVETAASDRSFYAALSYCWGLALPLKLTSDTKDKFERQIPWQELPTVSHDAVRVCQEMGIYNLWIDSLCIAQDSKADWQQESAMMDKYYENAVFTISASTSSSCSAPFLGPRNSDCLPKRVSLQLADSACVDVFARRMLATPVEILETRAWTFQENLLSKRVIDFSSVNIIWRCRESESIMYTQLPRRDDYRIKFREFQDFLSDTSTAKQYENESNHLFWLMHWSDMVQIYTKRDITYLTDRLPAFAGIAKRFAAKTHFAYCAGLWKELLPEALMWRLHRPTVDPPEGHRIPDEYIGPSWAWSSVRGQISFLVNAEGAPNPLIGGASVVSIDCTPVSSASPFGQVNSGLLVLEGMVSNVSISYTLGVRPSPYRISYDDKLFRPFFPDCALIHSKEGLTRARTSDSPIEAFSVPAICIVMGADAIQNELAYRWIMVLGKQSTGQYVRLGVLYYREHRENKGLVAFLDRGLKQRIEVA